jgi:ectoine hydroxylase
MGTTPSGPKPCWPRRAILEEIQVLLDEVPHLYAQYRPENVREKGSDAACTNFAAHMYSKPFAKLARHPRMVEPVMQIFGEPV